MIFLNISPECSTAVQNSSVDGLELLMLQNIIAQAANNRARTGLEHLGSRRRGRCDYFDKAIDNRDTSPPTTKACIIRVW